MHKTDQSESFFLLQNQCTLENFIELAGEFFRYQLRNKTNFDVMKPIFMIYYVISSQNLQQTTPRMSNQSRSNESFSFNLFSELRNRIVTMSCPFLKNVSRSMFQQSELTLKDAMRGNGLVLEFRALFESKKVTFQNCWKKIPKLSEYFASPTKSMPLYAAAKVRSQHEIGSDAAAF